MPLVNMTATGGGGGGSPVVTELETWDATSDLTALTITSAGTSTLYAGDGSTVRASIVVTEVGSPAAGWSLTIDASESPPILLSNVKATASGAGYISVQIEPAFSSSPDWVRDRWFAEVLVSEVALDGASASYPELLGVGVAPKGKIIAESGSVTIRSWEEGGSTRWTRETWDDSDSDEASYTTAAGSSLSWLYDAQRQRLAVDNGGTSFASDYTSAGPWDLDTIGQAQIASVDDTSAGSYSTGVGVTLYLYSANTSGGAKAGLSKIKLSVGAPRE